MRSFNLNKITSLGLRIALIMVVMAECVYGGRVEYNDDILSGISSEKYDFISSRISDNSRSAVVNEYMKNKRYYDSIEF